MGDRITIKSAADIEAMRHVCILAAETLKRAGEMVKAGITTEDINTFVHQYTIDAGAIPAPLNYKGFPKSVCTSVNDVVCHGIPSRKIVLRDGDIVNIDVTTIVAGFHGDTSKTFAVGKITERAQRLIDDTEECLRRGIAVVKPGARVRDIGEAIEKYAAPLGYGIVRDYTGHGIGRIFHEAPQIPHYRFTSGPNPRLVQGMIFTIEPMINLGSHETELDAEDGWTVYTADGSLSAQCEHTVLVTETGVDVLTSWDLLT